MSRIYSIDYLKFVLACFVAMGHSGLIQNHLTDATFVFGNGILRNAVPVFSVVSGYFFYMAVTKHKAMVWLRRVLILYLAWMAFYAPVWLPYAHSLRDVLRVLVYGYMHLWYVIGLFAAGVMIVLMLRLGRMTGLGRKPLVIVAALCALVGVAMEYASISDLVEISVHHYRNGLFIIFPFATIGYLIAVRVAEHGQESLPSARLIWLVALVAVLAMVIESWIVATIWGPVEHSFLEMPLSSLPAGAAIFLLVLRLDLPKPVVDLGFMSASIYFLHVAVQLYAATHGVSNEWLIFLLGIVIPMMIGLVFRRVMARFAGKPRGDRAASK